MADRIRSASSPDLLVSPSAPTVTGADSRPQSHEVRGGSGETFNVAVDANLPSRAPEARAAYEGARADMELDRTLSNSLPPADNELVTDSREKHATAAREQLITDEMASPTMPLQATSSTRRRIRISFVRRQRAAGAFSQRLVPGAEVIEMLDEQPRTGVRRLFQIRQHAQNIITRSLSQVTDLSQRDAMTDLLSESDESHNQQQQYPPPTLFPTTFANARAQAFGHKDGALVAVGDAHSIADSHSTTSVATTISGPYQKVQLRRRRYELKFLEFSENGDYRQRSLTRQDILDEVHGMPKDKLPNFMSSERARQTSAANAAFASQRGRDPPRRLVAGDKDSAWERKDRQANQKRQKLASAEMAALVRAKSEKAHQRQHGSRMALTMRDIRQVDPAFTAKAALWVRQRCIVVSLEHVRAIIMYDRLLLFDPENESVKQPIAYIQQRLSQGARNADEAFMPFEFRALEGILIHSCISVERDFHKIERSLVGGLLETLPTHSSPEHLERVRVEEQSLNYFTARTRKFQNVLQTLLDSDEDMANMYLTEKQKSPLTGRRNPMNHGEVEMLLESYLQVVDDLSTKAGLLNRAIDDTENLIEIHLNTNQNKLLQIQVSITVIMLLVASATTVFGIFGMNLPMTYSMRNLPHSQWFFYGTVLGTAAVLAVAAVAIAEWCRRQGQGLITWRLLRRNGGGGRPHGGGGRPHGAGAGATAAGAAAAAGRVAAAAGRVAAAAGLAAAAAGGGTAAGTAAATAAATAQNGARKGRRAEKQALAAHARLPRAQRPR